MKVLIVSFFALSLVVSSGHAQRSTISPAVALVRQLYTDFACEAVIDEPSCDERHQFVDPPRAVLARYFDDQLTRLWLADRVCVARSREICNLDFSPIWNSQDPPGTIAHIRGTKDPNVAEVELYHGPSGGKSVLRYSLVKTPAGLRIHDIANGNEWSLVSLLSRKP